MKSLISINYKFMEVSPKELAKLINLSKYTKGVEINVDVDKDEEMKYLSDLVFELKKNDLILQVHGEVTLELDKQIEFMKLIENYSDYLGYPIVVTMHTIYDDDVNISISKTLDYVSNLLSSINKEKIILCLENLNDIRGFNNRLNKDDIKPLVLNDEKLYFTYDIGHEIADYGSIINLDGYMFSDIRNVHLHSYNDQGVDHIPIYKNDRHYQDIIKALEFLIINHYEYNIVYEYGLEYCAGNTTIDKIKEYLNSIDLVSEKYN